MHFMDSAAEHGVSVLDVSGFPIESHWHIVWQKGKRLSPLAKVFQAHLLGQSRQKTGQTQDNPDPDRKNPRKVRNRR